MLCIIIPCHRVIRADGTLCGYGGGLWRKKWLLEHERKFATAVMGANNRRSSAQV
jgi:AraC family transcriptional regulator of adaptative response/methylated-DNA-[protein]-cysteine methyltransferase